MSQTQPQSTATNDNDHDHDATNNNKSSSSPQSGLGLKSELTNAEKIERRVKERNSWSTFFDPSPFAVAKMLISRCIYQAKIPPKKVLDQILPIRPLQFESLSSPPKNNSKTIQATWIGHATVLCQMGGWNIITDPMFSNRCSPSQYAGPKRYRKAPCTIRQLMIEEDIPIHVVLISHNHYDHLDVHSVKSIAACAIEKKKNSNHTYTPVTFVVALGLKDWFVRYIPDSCRGGNSVVELDWHETHCLEDHHHDGGGGGGSIGDNKFPLTITGLPAQHWSNRYGWDKDKTLWCGFGVTLTSSSSPSSSSSTSLLKFMFCGDTGYFDDAYEIGNKYGPFDLAAIPSEYT